MLRYCLGLGAFSANKPACHLFPTLAEYFMYSHLPSFCILLLCSAAQKMRSMLMKTSSGRAKPPVICLWQDGVHSTV
jgi:hypothetical protein